MRGLKFIRGTAVVYWCCTVILSVWKLGWVGGLITFAASGFAALACVVDMGIERSEEREDNEREVLKR